MDAKDARSRCFTSTFAEGTFSQISLAALFPLSVSRHAIIILAPGDINLEPHKISIIKQEKKKYITVGCKKKNIWF